MDLFTNQTVDGSSIAFRLRPDDGNREDQSILLVYGTWDGATVTLTVSNDRDGTFVPLRDAYGAQIGVFTADSGVSVDAGKHAFGKLTLSDAGASTSISAEHEESQ